MIKIAQIIDKATKGQEFLITYKDEIITQTITDGVFTVICEVIEFDETGKPITFVEERELELDLDNLGVVYSVEDMEVIDPETQEIEIIQVETSRPKTMREKLTELAGL